MATETLPAGFRRALGSGLILPEAQSRDRQVWTKDEGRLFERFLKLLGSREIKWQMRCEHEGCKGTLTRIHQDDGSVVLRCDHADRVFTQAF